MSERPTRHEIESIGLLHTGFPDKFGIPRQPGLVKEAWGEVRLHAKYRKAGVLRGLEGFSHVWISFLFHETVAQGWNATVRPPRLGGNARQGVFASRSPFRPNALGLSVLQIERIDEESGVITVSGVDIVDGTPVMDVKPYLPWSDAIPNARAEIAPPPQSSLATLPLAFSSQAESFLKRNPLVMGRELALLLKQVIREDPRPAYQQNVCDNEPRVYGLHLGIFNIRWQVYPDRIEVISIDEADEASERA